ncbi:MAG: ATP-dependent DNA helicase, partial [Methanomassiliicoccaceae archaeon]|nr:ATP-dependent DNA helicase [Methanomassiliicoccaceae archaeon]
MPSLFCVRCRSLTPPGSERCRVCGAPVEEEGKQHCLTDMTFDASDNNKKILSPDKVHAPYFPYEPRESQMDIVKDITRTLAAGDHIVMESGTGTGKTICALAGALHHAKMKEKKIIYLTRTISQSDQVMRELRSISRIRPVSGMVLSGRKRSCPLLRTLSGYDDILPHVLANLCEERKAKSIKDEGGSCMFYDRVRTSVQRIDAFCKEKFPTADELDAFCESSNVCPYEVRKSLIQNTDVIVAPYVHILSEDIRSNLLAHMRCDDEKILIIVDEAHNLIPAAREQGNFTIRMKDIDETVKEISTMKDPLLYRDIRAGDLVGFLRAVIKGIANEKLSLTVHESLIENDRIESRIRTKYSLTQEELRTTVQRMIDVGNQRTEYLLDHGTHELSQLFVLGVSLNDWISSDNDEYVKTIKSDKNGEMLCASCIDPSEITMFIRSLKGSIHMSGTLQPLEQYVRTMELPETTVTRNYPTPFPPENRSVVYVNDVTTRYEELKQKGMMEKIIDHMVRLCNSTERNTLVLFPSYSMMSKMKEAAESRIERDLYWEESGYQKRTMNSLERFRKGRNGVFFTV